ncbi:protein kinase WD40 [Hortaea werneckii]|nr:protein kinase WD40 [Hortaea werneckii]
MGQGYSTSLPPGSSALETAELSDLTFEKPLGGARFLRTVRARHQQGVVVAKVCVKANPGTSFKQYGRALRQERQALGDIPNVLSYQRIRETATLGLLVRQYVHSSLYDRISIRPFLENIEKKWIAFQLLCAVRDCHARGIFHGDIKSENVLVTSWGWVYLTDFASTFKPVYLPEDNPADFTYYYDTSARRTCYLAPERFLAAGHKPHEDNIVQWNMDIFSLGCVIAELFTEAPTFTLSQLFRYRKGEYDPTLALLNKVDDLHVRSLISSMIRLDPEERWHAQDYLDEYKSKAFPLYFYQHLHVLMQEVTDPTSGRKYGAAGKTNNGISDDRIQRVYDDFEMLSVSLGYDAPQTAAAPFAHGRSGGLFPLQVDLPNARHTASSALTSTGDDGTFILLNVVTSSMRSAGRASSKTRACELLLAFGERLPDEAKLDRILPYVMSLLDDKNELVLVAALRTMTQLLALVNVVSPINASIFAQYIFPRLQAFTNGKSFKAKDIVRATYATCLASLAETASRFLDITQALKAEGSLPASDSLEDDTENAATYFESYDTARAELLEAFEGQTKVFLTDHDSAVKRAFLSSVPSLCVFFGDERASDIILTHLNTYLNDTDWMLKCAFFKAIVGVAIYIGGAGLEDFVLPLMIQALADPQDFVVEQALRSLASMAELGLLQRSKTWELIDVVARFELHPNVWIKEAAVHFVCAATTYLSVADVRILVTPLIQPYLKVPLSTLSESELLDALRKPLPKGVLDLALEWAKRVDRGIFWKSARESKQLSYHATTRMPPTSSVVDLGPRALARTPKNDEDEQWLGRLRNAGMTQEDEMKILAFREYLWRAAQRMKKEGRADQDSLFEDVISLTRLDITPQTIIFDNDVQAYQERAKDQDLSERSIAEALEEAAGPQKEQSFKRLSLTGIPDRDTAGGLAVPSETSQPIDAQPRRLSGVKKQASGSLSSSPSSAVGLLGERGTRSKSSAAGLISGNETRNKALPAVATADATAAGKLDTPHVVRSARNSPGPQSRPRVPERARSRRAVHNYAGNDPTVLKLLDAVYVDNFPVDAAEFGPMIQPFKRGHIASSTNNISGPWHPQGQLLAVLGEHTAKISRIAVAPDHAFFLTASDDGTVKVWDSSRLERNVTHRSRHTHKLAPGAKTTSLCFVENTHTFVCTGSDGMVQVVKVDVAESANTTKYGKLRLLREWQMPTSSPGKEYAVWSEHYRGDTASTLVLATNLGRILSIDLRSTLVMFELHVQPQHGSPASFCMGRKRDWLLVGTTCGILELWDLRFRVRLKSWAMPSAIPVTRLQLYPARGSKRRDRVCISGGTAAGEITVWSIEKAICYEAYRPMNTKGAERMTSRGYELRNLDDERPDGQLSRVAGSVAADPTLSGATNTIPPNFTPMYFGAQQEENDKDDSNVFAVSGGPDGRVRFWDCDHLQGCRLISGEKTTPDEQLPKYTYSMLGLDTRVLSEKSSDADDMEGSTIESNKIASNATATTASAKRSTGGTAAKSGGPNKPSRYDAIRLSAQNLLDGHLDTITDVAVLERPFGMVLSADRAGQVFVHQ